jgi:putative Ca2+/H+ antiporter (TMEM165/GDT1 family)
MNFAIAFTVFPVILIGELPDKTMFASLVLSTRGRPLQVWAGAAAAFTVHVVIAVTVGVALFRLLPHRVVEAIVAAMFAAGAIFAVREAKRDRQRKQDRQGKQAGNALVDRAHPQGRVTGTAFIVVFLAEWGDLTQILTANLAARYHSALSVGTGALLALWSVAALAVVGGTSLLRWVNITTIRILTAVILTGLAAATAWLATR